MLTETRERFLKAILGRIPIERIVEVHLFSAIRQGQMETGVAVIAAEPEAEMPRGEALGSEAVSAAPSDVEPPAGEVLNAGTSAADHDGRLVVYCASYRFTRKGIERGKWEVDVVLEADAPLATIDVVVRGVQERAGEAVETTRLGPRELRTLISETAWQLSP